MLNTMIIELESYKDGGRTLIRPSNKKDLPLFKHCSGGMIAVTPEFFDEEVEPLLFLHGVAELTIESSSTNK